MEFNEAFTASLLHPPIVNLFQILIQINMEEERCMLSNEGVGWGYQISEHGSVLFWYVVDEMTCN